MPGDQGKPLRAGDSSVATYIREGAARKTEPGLECLRFPKAAREAERLGLGRDRKASLGRRHGQGLGPVPTGREVSLRYEQGSDAILRVLDDYPGCYMEGWSGRARVETAHMLRRSLNGLPLEN